MWVLVIGCVRPDSGPEAKLGGLSRAFGELGLSSRLELLRPDRSAPRRTADLLSRVCADQDSEPGLVLLRSHWSVPAALPSLHRLRARGHAVVIDVPTPVAAGVREILAAPRPTHHKIGRLLVETTWTPLAWPLADVVVQYAPDGFPWRLLAGPRQLTLTNGVDLGSRPLSTAWVHRTGITFICAGALGPWHGLDRLVAGMATSRHDHSRLLVVGDGPELPRLRSSVEALRLTHRVTYVPSTSGAALDAVMAEADVGVASLAEHRRGGAALSPLKTRDYLARGMPVLFAGDDPDLRCDPPFTFRVTQDDSPVPVRQVNRWLTGLRNLAAHSMTGLGTCSPRDIRSFAESRLQWRSRAEAILAALAQPSHV